MIVYPAIDIKGGKCVRLTQGLKDQEKVYYNNPIDVSLMWEKQGAKFLHIVDLDGAFNGTSENKAVIKGIIDEINLPIQVGGGIRSLETIEEWLDLGIERVILGTKALLDRDMLLKAVKTYPSKIVVSIDAKNGYVTTEGWVKTSRVKVLDFVTELQEMGTSAIIYTDISRDGMLIGPNLEGIKRVKETTSMEVIASGGIASIEDLLKLKAIGVEGAIVGKALYENRFALRETEVVLP
ncbi:1-(5-phosphoribosyl)-5-[(5-phosphoribosylamino)methylideneamino]imidazole-4-carboxamide isomerase [Alkaliphilus transvaalensis]|uniref:1-(5-phosphoribosyl)-5-[(5- phosphoribosylamino)methylideneamino]imidazole-4- carboxamide isomerase n=1 Tax=Alkaliphilus transvaalensis TaxID=114628 RepID=UPI000479572F|nr:1-(5-phosphoribosyl)-5-[(5-phosphoribosylamino)methylideneamino]imidazole-4-carboxamide isomerase [Alkaliphilus transvaalensis]